MILTLKEKAKLLRLIAQIREDAHNASELELLLNELKEAILFAEEER